MSHLFVLKCQDETIGEQILAKLRELQTQYLITIEDTALITLNTSGKPKIRQANDLVGTGALGGAFWGMLFGLLFLSSLLGAAIGAGVGAIAGKMRDYGINDDFMKQVGSAIHPGEAALFVLTRNVVADKIWPELKRYQFEVIQTSLNFTVEQMQAFERTKKIDTLQPPYSLFRREIEAEILPYCEAADIGVLVYGALAHGLLGGSFTPQTTFPTDDWRSQHESFSGEGFRRNIAVVERLKRVAQEQGMTIAQLAVAWVLAQPAVDVAIVGARTPEQLAQNAAASGKHLTQETLRVIEAIVRDTVPIGSSAPE